MNAPIRVAVTGAAGNIGYALLWRLASGDCFGADQPIILQLLEIPPGMERLNGVVMELNDSAFPLVHDIIATSDAEVAFQDADAIFLVGSRPRSAGMERADLVAANGPIFVGQGKAMGKVASRNTKVITVGNPCNTNCLIAMHSAEGLDSSCFSAMTRLDQNRGTAQLALKKGVPTGNVSDLIIWGNHSNAMYPDVQKATVNGEAAAQQYDTEWLQGEFVKVVSTRGKAIIDARGASSAASAASAAVDHMRDWWNGSGDRIVSMAIKSEGWYGVPEGLIFSFPCTVAADGTVTVVEGLELDAFAKSRLQLSIDELEGEKAAVSDLIG